MSLDLLAASALKTCTACGQGKAIEAFRVRSGQGGHTYHVSNCKACESARHALPQMRARARMRRAERRVAMEPSYRNDSLFSEVLRTSTPLPTADELSEWYQKGCRIA